LVALNAVVLLAVLVAVNRSALFSAVFASEMLPALLNVP
jgi:hypothetical protein